MEIISSSLIAALEFLLFLKIWMLASRLALIKVGLDIFLFFLHSQIWDRTHE